MWKIYDDMRSPWRTLRLSFISFSATELIITFEFSFNTKNLIQFIKLCGKLDTCKHLIIKNHSIKSNAFCISTLKTAIWLLCLVSCAKKKPCNILRPLRKLICVSVSSLPYMVVVSSLESSKTFFVCCSRGWLV
jgi:hypothetical protein